MDNLIVKTKFVPPKLNKNLWKKDELWHKYRQMKNYSLTILKAGPGYGKSTTLSSFLKKNYSNSFYWYSIDKNELDSVLFFLNLVHAFNFNNSDLGKETIIGIHA